MPARLGKEVFGCDCGADASAETAACHAVGETRWVMLFGVTGEGRHGGEWFLLVVVSFGVWVGGDGVVGYYEINGDPRGLTQLIRLYRYDKGWTGSSKE